MNRCVLIALTVWVGTGCYDDHWRRDAGQDSAIPRDAAPPPDAWGDANTDAGPGPCFVDGRPIAGLPESRADRSACACPSGTTGAVAFREPSAIALDEGAFALCVPAHRNRGITASLCDEGRVIHHFQGMRSERLGVDFASDSDFGFACLDASSCLFAEAQLPESMRGGCLYADYTPALSARIGTGGDCAALRRDGLCAIDCGCETPNYARCYGLSETHTIGVCTLPPACFRNSDCRVPPDPNVCVFATSADVVEDIDETPRAGRCTPTPSCAALREATGDTWSCGPEVPF